MYRKEGFSGIVDCHAYYETPAGLINRRQGYVLKRMPSSVSYIVYKCRSCDNEINRKTSEFFNIVDFLVQGLGRAYQGTEVPYARQDWRTGEMWPDAPPAAINDSWPRGTSGI